MRIAVTAGYSRSLHAIALVDRLAAAGCEVVLGLEVSVWTWSRLRFYLRQLGPARLIGKARAKLAPGGARSAHGGEVTPLLDYCRAHGIQHPSFSAACRSVDAKHHVVTDLNHADALAALRLADVDWVAYAGGGILREDFLAVPRRGVLNAHGGPLPAFRGMNVAEWSLLHGVRPEVVVIQVDAGIDTGPILHEKQIPDHAWTSIPTGRGTAARVSVEALLETVAAAREDGLAPRTQRSEDGRQFFVLADPLLEVLDARIADGFRPTRSPVDFRFPAARPLPEDSYM